MYDLAKTTQKTIAPLNATAALRDDRVLRWPEVEHRCGICRSYAHELVSRGQFPKPIKLGQRASGWLESEILAWLQNRVHLSRDGDNGQK